VPCIAFTGWWDVTFTGWWDVTFTGLILFLMVICQYKGGEEWLQGRWRMATREVEAMYCLVICQYKGGEEWLQGRWRPCIVWSFALWPFLTSFLLTNDQTIHGLHLPCSHSSPPLYCIVWSFVRIKKVRNGYKGGGCHVLFGHLSV
jgi:hypothetical protein